MRISKMWVKDFELNYHFWQFLISIHFEQGKLLSVEVAGGQSIEIELLFLYLKYDEQCLNVIGLSPDLIKPSMADVLTLDFCTKLQVNRTFN